MENRTFSALNGTGQSVDRLLQSSYKTCQPITLSVNQLFFFAAAFFFAAGLLAGRLFPKEPWKRFPFAVFLSPLPMILI
jgi:hypothetical protein